MSKVQEQIPALRDGFQVERLSVASHNVITPGSHNPFIDTGMWSSVRGPFQGVQDFSTRPGGNQVVWLIHSNEKIAVNYSVGCGEVDRRRTIISPFPPGTIAKNLFFPYQEFMIEELQWTDKPGNSGCLAHLLLQPFSFMALVPKPSFVAPRPSITHFLPGHDSRILSSGLLDESSEIKIELQFSINMNCRSVVESISIEGRTENSVQAAIDPKTIRCSSIEVDDRLPTELPSQPEGIWLFTAILKDIEDGVYRLTVNNASDSTGTSRTMAKDHFLFRVGKYNNPVVFPLKANYTSDLLKKNRNGDLVISHKASGADKFRYSMNWGRTYSPWHLYTGGETLVNESFIENPSEKTWDGNHVIVEYCKSQSSREYHPAASAQSVKVLQNLSELERKMAYFKIFAGSKLAGSSSHAQHGDFNLREGSFVRRLPHIYLQGAFNKHGMDASHEDFRMRHQRNSTWTYPYMDEWPSTFVLNVCKSLSDAVSAVYNTLIIQ